MRFTATLELGGKTATGIEVPAEVVEALGAGKRPAVVVTLGGSYTYRSTVGVMGGRSLLPVSAEHRAAAGLAAGDEVVVDVEVDDQPRTVEVPDDLAAALDRHPSARAAFDALSHSRKRQLVLGVEGAKKPETRQKRVDAAVADLA